MLYFVFKFIKRYLRRLLYSLMGILISAAANHAFAALTIEGRVVGVSDGDTITVLDAQNRQHRIRMMGIDAPESSQAHGQAAKSALSEMVYRKTVTVVWSDKDRYGRILGVVWLNGADINLSMVAKGYAWHYRQYAGSQSPQDRAAYSRAEQQARDARKGVWRDVSPVPPWDYRKDKRSGGQQSSSMGYADLSQGLVLLKAVLEHANR